MLKSICLTRALCDVLKEIFLRISTACIWTRLCTTVTDRWSLCWFIVTRAIGDDKHIQWSHNGRDDVSNHQPHDCLLNPLFRHISTKTWKLRVTGLCEGNSPMTGEFPTQRVSNAENVPIWWRQNDNLRCWHWLKFQLNDSISVAVSWHGNASCITGPLWGNPLLERRIPGPVKGRVLRSFDIFFVGSLNKLLNNRLITGGLRRRGVHVCMLPFEQHNTCRCVNSHALGCELIFIWFAGLPSVTEFQYFVTEIALSLLKF